ncbi:MAG: hypothetical protein GKS05_02395 [Nitrospirales bacterium]|nr:hypothetical protein [Nitrospirales bacterium]
MPTFLLTWIHLVAVVTLVGGLICLDVVLRPILNKLEPMSQRMEVIRQTNRRFRTIAWVSIITLIVTGAAQMLNESGTARIETTWGVILMIKLLVFAITFGLLLIHDFILDPHTHVPDAIPTPSRPPHQPSRTHWLRHTILFLTLCILLIASYLTAM